MGTYDNTLDGWTVARGSSIFYPIVLDGLSDDYPVMNNARLGANALNASFLHNVLFTPQVLEPSRWVRV